MKKRKDKGKERMTERGGKIRGKKSEGRKNDTHTHTHTHAHTHTHTHTHT